MLYLQSSMRMVFFVTLLLGAFISISYAKAADSGDDHSYLPPWMRNQSATPTMNADKPAETPMAARMAASDMLASKPKQAQTEPKPGFLSHLWRSLDFIRAKWSLQ